MATIGAYRRVSTFMQKEAASALRSRLSMSRAGGLSIASLFGKPVGALNVTGGHVHGAAVAPEFQGLGIGKKLYGETMRRQPGAALMSDTQGTSTSAQRVWTGMAQRRGYNVQVTPGYQNMGGVNTPRYRWTGEGLPGVDEKHVFTGSLPAAAQLPKAPVATGLIREGAEQLMENVEIGGGAAQRLDPLHARINARGMGLTAPPVRKVAGVQFSGFVDELLRIYDVSA